MTNPKHKQQDLFFEGSLEKKIDRMNILYQNYGSQLLADSSVMTALARIKQYCAALSDHMAAMDLGTLCTKCAQTSNGGCCSRYMEANSDVILLLINRLQRPEAIQLQHDRAAECRLLGERGCTLAVKPMFCLNYNCKHISDKATGPEMTRLEQLAGQLLTEQTRLEELILERL